jgi:hypothetical protein
LAAMKKLIPIVCLLILLSSAVLGAQETGEAITPPPKPLVQSTD